MSTKQSAPVPEEAVNADAKQASSWSIVEEENPAAVRTAAEVDDGGEYRQNPSMVSNRPGTMGPQMNRFAGAATPSVSGEESDIAPSTYIRSLDPEVVAEIRRTGAIRTDRRVYQGPPIDLQDFLCLVDPQHITTLDKMIISSPFRNMDSASRASAIMLAFNKYVSSPVIVDPGARGGERLEPGKYLLAHRNRTPEIAVGHGQRLTLKITGTYTETAYIGDAERRGIFDQNETLVGAYGSYVLNVPQGRVARLWLGNDPKLYGQGRHVIHHPLLRVGLDNDTAHPWEADPKRFVVDISDTHITHGNLHIVRVPVGKLGKLTVDTHPMILPYRKEPYCFNTPLYKFEGFVDESDRVISHGSIFIIRVPNGQVATVWSGARPLFLEARDEAYYFDDPTFKLEDGVLPLLGGESECFRNARSKIIKHGAMFRLRPGVEGDLEVAVVQCDTLDSIEFIDRACTIENPNWSFLGFLNMGMQTYIFPTERARQERLLANINATPDETNYIPVTTKDSLKFGLKLLVAFEVEDPRKVMRSLRIKDILDHVEKLAVSDMALAMSHSTSQNFLSMATIGNVKARHGDDEMEQREHKAQSVSDEVRAYLARHLKECGLNLVRFNVEESKVLDAQLAKEMSNQALVAATASAEQAVIGQKTAVARANAEMGAMARKVQQEQENQILISKAKAELEAARLEAEGVLVNAEAEAKAAAMIGEMYQKYPELLTLELCQQQMDALGGSSVTFISTDLAETPFGSMNAFSVMGSS